ncbi:MAG: dihydrodipicolinate synthase family protein [Microbacteriaceae bacterium]
MSALDVIRNGAVIPAHPLALDENRTLDRTRQRALSRYYIDAGVGGIAVGVHTTQFAIRQHGIFRDVLAITSDTVADWSDRPIALVAGVIGDTAQAVAEAELAAELGYTAVMLNVAAWKGRTDEDILRHAREVAAVMPLIGFSLLPEVGGFHLSYDFWRQFAEIDNVVAIKMAPFNRYRTLDIVRAVVDARAEERITLYTGNDDHIVLDLLQPFLIPRDGSYVSVAISGGLLGHWSVWTHTAVSQFASITEARGQSISPSLLGLDSIVTDSNGAIYDALNDFAGCIPGCLEVLRRQGLVEGIWCLDPAETLSPGQLGEIDRVYADHPALNDDRFVAEHLAAWLA